MESKFLDITTTTDRKTVPNFVSKYPPQKKIPQNDWNFIKLQSFSGIFLRHLQFFKIFFVSGITFLYISSTTEWKIRAGFHFTYYIYHFSRGYVNMESYVKKASCAKTYVRGEGTTVMNIPYVSSCYLRTVFQGSAVRLFSQGQKIIARFNDSDYDYFVYFAVYD